MFDKSPNMFILVFHNFYTQKDIKVHRFERYTTKNLSHKDSQYLTTRFNTLLNLVPVMVESTGLDFL